MTKTEAIKALGVTTKAQAARACGITPSAFGQWPEELNRDQRDRVQAALYRLHIESSKKADQNCLTEA